MKMFFLIPLLLVNLVAISSSTQLEYNSFSLSFEIFTQLLTTNESCLSLTENLTYYKINEVKLLQQHIEVESMEIYQYHLEYSVNIQCKKQYRNKCKNEKRICDSCFNLRNNIIQDDKTKCRKLPKNCVIIEPTLKGEITMNEPLRNGNFNKKSNKINKQNTIENSIESINDIEEPIQQDYEQAQMNNELNNILFQIESFFDYSNEELDEEYFTNNKDDHHRETDVDEELSAEISDSTIQAGRNNDNINENESDENIKKLIVGSLKLHQPSNTKSDVKNKANIKSEKTKVDPNIQQSKGNVFVIDTRRKNIPNDLINNDRQIETVQKIENRKCQGHNRESKGFNDNTTEISKENVYPINRTSHNEPTYFVNNENYKKDGKSSVESDYSIQDFSEIQLLSQYALIQLDEIDANNYKRTLINVIQYHKQMTVSQNQCMYYFEILTASTVCQEEIITWKDFKHQISKVNPRNEECLKQIIPPVKLCQVQLFKSTKENEEPRLLKSKCFPYENNITINKNNSSKSEINYRQQAQNYITVDKGVNASKKYPKKNLKIDRKDKFVDENSDKEKALQTISNLLYGKYGKKNDIDSNFENDEPISNKMANSIDVSSGTDDLKGAEMEALNNKDIKSKNDKVDKSDGQIHDSDNTDEAENVQHIIETILNNANNLANTNSESYGNGEFDDQSPFIVEMPINRIDRVRRGENSKLGASVSENSDNLDETLRPVVDFAVKYISDNSVCIHRLGLLKLLSIDRQVVSGMLYDLKLQVASTGCEKRNASSACVVDETNVNEAEMNECEVQVWEQLWKRPPYKISGILCEKGYLLAAALT